jgi:hypothetical protein
MKTKELPPLEVLNALIEYNPDTGLTHWKVNRCNGQIKAGDVAGHHDFTEGYLRIGIDNKVYKLHRIVWALCYNEVLTDADIIDHKNGDTSDNRISNLRKVSKGENNTNRRLMKSNTSGHRGVHYVKRDQRWRAFINIDGKRHSLGYHKTKKDAITARLNAEREYNIFVR